MARGVAENEARLPLLINNQCVMWRIITISGSYAYHERSANEMKGVAARQKEEKWPSGLLACLAAARLASVVVAQ